MELEPASVRQVCRRIILSSRAALQGEETPLCGIGEGSNKLLRCISVRSNYGSPQPDLARHCNRRLQLVLHSFVEEYRRSKACVDGKRWLNSDDLPAWYGCDAHARADRRIAVLLLSAT